MLHLTVARTEDVTPSIRRFELRAPDGAPLPAFRAGAHIKVEVTLPGGRRDERCYSLMNATRQNGCYEIAVQRAPDSAGGSIFMWDSLPVGRPLIASLPRNDFPLSTAAEEHLLLAGGIGITPILSMAEELRAAGRSFELHYSARSPEQMAFRNRVVTASGGRASLYFDGGAPENGMKLDALLDEPRQGRHVYVCGPRGMIDAVMAVTKERGWARSLVHFELFAPTAPSAGDRDIALTLRRSGKTLLVSARQSILDALIEAGLDPLYDCRRGECGSCVVRVLDGTPDHRDYVLSDTERQIGGKICPCVSRSRSAHLTLDL